MMTTDTFSALFGCEDLTPKDQFITVFVPSLTRDKVPIDHNAWKIQAVKIMSKLFGGSTVIPGYGGWYDEEDNEVKTEDISMVVSFISNEECNKENMDELKQFLHKMGKETEQGEIGILLGNTFYRIREFES